MDTFHIAPNSELAHKVVEEVRNFDRDVYIAIRGKLYDGVEDIYTVSVCPDKPHKYMWTYVLTRDWLADYDKLA